MNNKFKTLLKAGVGCVGCVAVIGLAQAAQLTPVSDVKANTSWQDIKSTSFDDANHDGIINVGEKVTFTVDMHKTYWGVHDFDALKFWIDSPSGKSLLTKQFVWDFDPSDKNATEVWLHKDAQGHWIKSDVSYKPWTGGDMSFTFDYTFTTAGVFDLAASVMCSADLSGLVGVAQDFSGLKGLPQDDKLMTNDWSEWTKNTTPHVYQGETEKYKFTVVKSPVPEPETYAMLLVGLGLLGFTARRRNDFIA